MIGQSSGSYDRRPNHEQNTIPGLLAVIAVLLGLNIVKDSPAAEGQVAAEVRNKAPAQSALFPGSDPPVGSVVAYLKSLPGSPPPGDDWVECNGQVLDDPDSPFDGQVIPDLNGITETRRFLRGSSTSGAIGGGEAHNHQWYEPEAEDVPQDARIGLHWAGASVTYNPDGTPRAIYEAPSGVSIPGYTTNASSLPSYYEVVWIMKVKTEPSADPCPADITGNGEVEVVDFLILLGSWGPCD
jgi:hypothetical protein